MTSSGTSAMDDARRLRRNRGSTAVAAGAAAAATAAHDQQAAVLADFGFDAENVMVLQALPAQERDSILAQLGLSDHPAFADEIVLAAADDDDDAEDADDVEDAENAYGASPSSSCMPS